jgi:beta-glucosidase
MSFRNTGSRRGAEVVELYVSDGHSKVDRPTHELKGFRRVELNPGESQTLQFAPDRGALS